MTSAAADTVATTTSVELSRADQVAAIKAKWYPQLDAQYARIMAAKAKLAKDSVAMADVKFILDDFNAVRTLIANNLASETSILEDVNAYAEEEVGEFAFSIPSLEKMVKELKTITCVKGKTTKKITAVKAKCPTGYKLKK